MKAPHKLIETRLRLCFRMRNGIQGCALTDMLRMHMSRWNISLRPFSDSKSCIPINLYAILLIRKQESRFQLRYSHLIPNQIQFHHTKDKDD